MEHVRFGADMPPAGQWTLARKSRGRTRLPCAVTASTGGTPPCSERKRRGSYGWKLKGIRRARGSQRLPRAGMLLTTVQPMPMLRLTRHQRAMVAEKLLDTANIAIGGLVFGQLVAGPPFSIRVAGFGIWLWLIGFASALALSKEAP